MKFATLLVLSASLFSFAACDAARLDSEKRVSSQAESAKSSDAKPQMKQEAGLAARALSPADSISNQPVSLKDADAALANLQRHGVRYYGPRVKEGGEAHIDFEDPDGHMLEYWARASFEPLPDRPSPAGQG